MFEEIVGYENHLGLFAEETGSRGEQLGGYYRVVDGGFDDFRQLPPSLHSFRLDLCSIQP